MKNEVLELQKSAQDVDAAFPTILTITITTTVIGWSTESNYCEGKK